MLSPPALVQPQPLFLASSAASQIVMNDHDSYPEGWFDQDGLERLGETAVVNPSALKLVNNFLDQLLFNFLAISKSSSLASLRPAVVETLKPKLAKDAIHQADQELEECLGRDDDEEFRNGIEPSRDWDLELVWKHTRLRCMVYSSLGDMEEEDEDYYTEPEHLHPKNIYSKLFEVVLPATAIFLTSILEFMGEQVLTVAGRAAYHRISKQQKDERDGSSVPENIADRVVVEDIDVERVALDRTLGRFWRGWKKCLRSPNASNPHSVGQSYSTDWIQSQSQPGSVAAKHQVPEINHRYRIELEAEKLSKSEAVACSINVPKSSHNSRWDAGVAAGSFIEPETVALGIDAATLKPIPVPVRSPLREALRTKLTSGELSVQGTQFAVTPGSCPKSSRLVPTLQASVQPTRTNQAGSAGSETSFARPLTPPDKITQNASDIAPKYSDAVIFQSESHLHPALRSAPSPRSAARVRLNAPVGRDAKVMSESGFGDFIRSTGRRRSRDDFAVEPPRQTNTSAHRVGAPYVPILVSKSLAATGTYNRLQARDAVVFGDNLPSSGLIDFIRQGPPSEKGHCIPRTVTPPCTTMDSGQISAALSCNCLSTLPEGRDAQTNFCMDASTKNTSVKKKPAVQSQLSAFDQEGIMLKRKICCIKDPHAIDYSDHEEVDDEFGLPRGLLKGQPKRSEESLIDFLNNAPPPESSMTSTVKEGSVPLRKKTIMGRFSRSKDASSSSSIWARNSLLARNSTLKRLVPSSLGLSYVRTQYGGYS